MLDEGPAYYTLRARELFVVEQAELQAILEVPNTV